MSKTSSSIFQVDLSGILRILSDHLYSRTEVFLRELVQNAMDAIKARALLEQFDPSITVEYFNDSGNQGLIIYDNGVGLTTEEVEEFLAKIGSSSKSGAIEKLRGDFIGQFGIGLLSCFMVSDEITVISKSAKNNESIKWIGKIDGTYKTEKTEDVGTVGTKVILKIKPEADFSQDSLIEHLRGYTEFLEIPIHLEINGNIQDSYKKSFPWEQTTGDNALVLGQQMFGERFQNYIEIKNRLGKNIGIAYILPRSTSHVQKQYGRVYIKKMFITENCEEILPDWAFFTRIIINSESLSPTASREGIYLDSNAIELKEDIENSLRSYFIELGKTAPKVLTDIIQSHNAAIKQMALENLDFLKLIYPWIPFPTSQGQLTLEEALKRTKTIYHVPDVDEYRQVLPIANANDQLIVNSGYIYDAELLDVIDSIDIKTNYIKVDAAYFGNTLEDLSLDEHDAHAKRLEALGEHLSKFGCRLDIKKFKPDSIPALYHANQNLMFSRDVKSIQEQSGDLWGEVSRSVYNAKSEQKSTLFLNFENKTIQSLLMNDKPDLDMTIIQVIYTNAMLMGHYPLSKEELQSVDSNLHGLIEVALQKNK